MIFFHGVMWPCNMPALYPQTCYLMEANLAYHPTPKHTHTLVHIYSELGSDRLC